MFPGAGGQGFLQVFFHQGLRGFRGGAGGHFDAFFGQQPLGLLPQTAGDDMGYAQVIQPFGEAPGSGGGLGMSSLDPTAPFFTVKTAKWEA